MYFEMLVETVFAQSPLQKKRINKLFGSQNDAYRQFCEELSSKLINNLLKSPEQQRFACDSYLKMCRDFLNAQIRFKQTGVYPILDAKIAKQEVYDNPEVMKYYMAGLLLSYMFWPNHYKLFEFFKANLNLPVTKPVNYLEIGVGHGLFTYQMISEYA